MRRALVAAVLLAASLAPVAAAEDGPPPHHRPPAHHRATTHRHSSKHKAKPKPKRKPTPANNGSLATGSGQLPGPAILYRAPVTAPPLTNTGVWKAAPILVSGASAYRSGEYLYQDYLYDDHGAHLVGDPTNPQDQQASDLFSKPNGTVDYPTAAGYANNAADLVEFRVKPLASATAFRLTLNTLTDPKLIAFSVAIGGIPGQLHPFPFGANVSAPAALFLTVHPNGSALVATLQTATGQTVAGPTPSVHVDLVRHQIEVDVPHRDWNPGRSTVRLAAGVGLWDASRNRYLAPQATADATHPGGAGTATAPAAFLNVAFRFHEPLPSVTASTGAVLDTAWWRDHDQGHALAANDISSLYANVDFGKLLRKTSDESNVPRVGVMDRILSTHFNLGPGVQYAHLCGFNGAIDPNSCQPEYLGQLQPFAVYIPAAATDNGRYGMTLLLHSLSANYNQFAGSRNQSQFANRPLSSIVITPESRGPDQFYQGVGGAEVFEAWADMARRYRLDPAYSDIAGYSMGGFGTFRLGAQFPDLFARAQPTVGEESDRDVLPSLRNVPLLMWNNLGDELVNPAEYLPDAQQLSSLGLRYELDAYQPCEPNPGCSPLFPSHLELAVNDQYAPAAAFLGSAKLDPNPARVTYVDVPSRNRPDLGLNGDHAYWLSKLTLRNPSQNGPGGQPMGELDVRSLGFGVGESTATALSPGTGTLTGGNLGPLSFTRSGETWGPAPPSPRADTLVVNAVNVASATIDVRRAHVDCRATVNVTTDGPIALTLLGCGRIVRAG